MITSSARSTATTMSRSTADAPRPAPGSAHRFGRRGFLSASVAGLGLAALGAPSAANARSPRTLSGARQLARRRTPAPLTSLQFGLDTSINNESMTIAQKYQQLTTAYGCGLGAHMKFFDGGGGWSVAYKNFTDMGWGHKPGEVRPVMCAKTHTDAAFTKLMTDMALATGHTRWMACFWQEVNDDIRDGNISVAQYRATWLRMDALRKAHPSGSLVNFVPIMNAYVVEDQAALAAAGGFDAVTLCKGLPIDMLGYDLYDNAWRPGTWNAAKYLAPAEKAATACGVGWCIPEFGIQVSTKTAGTETERANKLQTVINYCNASPTFKWLNYWEGKGVGGDWTLVSKPSQTIMHAALMSG